jgi:hypothetical protein
LYIAIDHFEPKFEGAKVAGLAMVEYISLVNGKNISLSFEPEIQGVGCFPALEIASSIDATKSSCAILVSFQRQYRDRIISPQANKHVKSQLSKCQTTSRNSAIPQTITSWAEQATYTALQSAKPVHVVAPAASTGTKSKKTKNSGTRT